MAIADIIKRNSPASSGTCRQTSPQKTHRSHLKEVEVALPLTAEPTPSSWAALEARSRNCVRAALDSGTAGCGALGEVVAGPCAEVVGRCWEAEEVVDMGEVLGKPELFVVHWERGRHIFTY